MKKNNISIDKKDKEELKKMCFWVMKNCDEFIKEMEMKMKNNHPISMLEQQIICEYTITYLQVRAILRGIENV